MQNQATSKIFDCNWVPIGNGYLTLWHRPGAKAISKLKVFGCNCIITLLSLRESAPNIGKLVENAGMEWIWLPLENGQPPQDLAAKTILSALPTIAERLKGGNSILIHCSAGIHRTGMVAYAILRWHGYDEERALATIEKMRPHTYAGLQRKQINWGNEYVLPTITLVTNPNLIHSAR